MGILEKLEEDYLRQATYMTNLIRDKKKYDASMADVLRRAPRDRVRLMYVESPKPTMVRPEWKIHALCFYMALSGSVMFGMFYRSCASVSRHPERNIEKIIDERGK